MFELQIRGQAFRDDWCEVEPIYCCFFSRRVSELARELTRGRDQIRKLPISHPILTSSPGTAALRNCQSSASRLAVAYREASSRVERFSHVASTHPRNDYQSLRWPSSFTQRLYEYSKETELLCRCTQHSSSAVIAHGFWAHIGSIPWATLNRQTSLLALRRGASRTARNLFAPLPYRP